LITTRATVNAWKNSLTSSCVDQSLRFIAPAESRTLEGSHTKAHDLSGGRQENRCGAKSAMGEVQVEEAA